MKNKRIGAFVLAGLGVAMIVYAMSAMSRISDAKGKVSGINSMISGSSGGRMVGKQLSAEVSQYDTKVRLLMIAGVAFAVVGAIGIYRYRKG